MTLRRVRDDHAEQMRALAGEWHFETLEIDGSAMPAAAFAQSKLLLDGDRFRMESPEATYGGQFRIDTSTKPMHIDIDFVEGPEAGNRSCGVFELNDDRLTICLGLVGAPRPTDFVTRAGSGHALERLRRGSSVAAAADAESVVNPAEFSSASGASLARLQGTWLPVRLVTNGEEMRADWLPFGSRTTEGDEAKVVFGGQVMLHVKLRIDESVTPTAVDYLHLRGRDAGKVSKGIMEWMGDEVTFAIAAPGHERPTDFSASGKALTFSRWKRADGSSARRLDL